MSLKMTHIVSATDISEYIALQVQTQGWCIVEDFLPGIVISQLRDELMQQWARGEFSEAGVGRGNSRVINKSLRSDEIKWLNMESMTEAQHVYWQAMQNLRMTLNQQLFLGLVEFESHLALYAPGSYYHKHVDQFRGVGLREVTAILYLNNDWHEGDGGELLLYESMDTAKSFKRIQPYGGQLVVFLSAEFPHEVLPASRQRLSITGWFKKRDIN